MLSLKMVNFCKDAKCPSSEDLLAFRNGEMAPAEASKVQKHLEICEFCSAEVEMYHHVPQHDGGFTVGEIPAPLYDLAESLLSRRRQNFLLKKLLNEAESLTHT